MAISNLYVTGLPDGVDDEMFRQLFDEYGTIVSIKLFAQSNYGFVKYSTVDEAQAVITELNGCMWGNSTLIVKFANKDQGQNSWSGSWSGSPGGGSSFRSAGGSQYGSNLGAPGAVSEFSGLGWTGISPPSSSRGGETAIDQVYVKGLPREMNDDELLHCFAGYGEVVWHRVLKKESSNDSVALVQMGTPEEAQWLVENLHGNIPQGLTTPVSVTFSTPPRGKTAGKGGGWTSYTGASSWRSSTPSGCGGKGDNNGSRGRYEPYSYEPYSVSVATSQKRSASPASPVAKAAAIADVGYNDSSNLYVKGLPKHADELYMYKLFAPFGAITSVRAQAAEWGTIGFVKYVQSQDAEVAIENISGQSQPEGSILQVSVKTPGRVRGLSA